MNMDCVCTFSAGGGFRRRLRESEAFCFCFGVSCHVCQERGEQNGLLTSQLLLYYFWSDREKMGTETDI